MKEYCIQVITNKQWITQLDLLQDLLDSGWTIERADTTSEMIVYILSAEEE